MNEDILRMAQEAGMEFFGRVYVATPDDLRRFAALAFAAGVQQGGKDWRQSAYAQLGFARDSMSDANVEVVQRFLDAAMQQEPPK